MVMVVMMICVSTATITGIVSFLAIRFSLSTHNVGNCNHRVIPVRMVVLASVVSKALQDRGIVLIVEARFLVLGREIMDCGVARRCARHAFGACGQQRRDHSVAVFTCALRGKVQGSLLSSTCFIWVGIVLNHKQHHAIRAAARCHVNNTEARGGLLVSSQYKWHAFMLANSDLPFHFLNVISVDCVAHVFKHLLHWLERRLIRGARLAEPKAALKEFFKIDRSRPVPVDLLHENFDCCLGQFTADCLHELLQLAH
mmetsp:Transcript_97542/g.157300  ORF Transcript_97542/g.157300 Transcript_97542/m.157300 type:complete len:256 (+) Transcript_97542:761-1528(+)